MTHEELSRERRRRICTVLPWATALVATVVYLVTVNPWVSINSQPVVTQVAGWEWAPAVTQPVLFLVAWPLRILPAKALPLVLNLLTGILAGLTVFQLARSIAILPRDRLASFRATMTADTGWELPLAWLPPVLGAVAMGLQMTFWEHATAATGEMFDLFLLAYVTRSLVEYRHSERPKWLDRALLLAALAATNSYAGLGYLPVVIFAVWWLKGIDFLEQRFLVRASLLLAAGLSLYFLQPLLAALTPGSPFDFAKALKSNLGAQVRTLIELGRAYYYSGRHVALLLVLISLLPVLFLSLRWRSFSGGSMYVGASLVTVPFHIAHAAFLGICLWAFFDPPFGPRVVTQQLGYLPCLTVYYLAALSVGYFSGYFLQFFGEYPPDEWAIGAPTRRKIAHLVRGIGIAVVVFVPVVLVGKNLPALRLLHSDLLRRQAAELANGLPTNGCVYLSDDPLRLGLTKVLLGMEGKGKSHLGVETRMLSVPRYLQALHRQYPTRFPDPGELPLERETEPATVVNFLVSTMQTNLIYYLHPSFGYYFEALYQEPRGPVFALRPYRTNSLFVPVPPAELLAGNEQYWSRLAKDLLEPLTNRVAATIIPQRGPWQTFLKKLKAKPEPDNVALLVAAWQSRQLTAFAVDQQRAGQLAPAGDWFRLALALKPDNLSAAVNLVSNTNLLAGQPVITDRSRPPEADFGSYRSWEQVIGENGPFDHPNFNYSLGMVFGMNTLYRQAAGQFHRACQLDPTFTPAMLMLCTIYGVGNRFDDVLFWAAQIRTNRGYVQLTPTEQIELSLCEAGARLGKKEWKQAEKLINAVLAAHTNDATVTERVFSLYSASGLHTNALQVALYLQQLVPTNAAPWVNEAYSSMQLGLYSNAVTALNRALELDETSVHARFNRAYALLRIGEYERSRKDYQFLNDLDPNVPQVHYGLAEVAFQLRDTNTAIQQYTRFLTNAPPGSAEIPQVRQRLQELQPSRK